MQRWLKIVPILILIFNVVPTSAQDNADYPIITPENVDQLTEVQRLGTGKPQSVNWREDGTISVYTDSGTYIHDATTLEVINFTPADGIIEDSADAQSTGPRAYLGYDALYLEDDQNTTPRQLHIGASDTYWRTAWSPDKQRLAYSAYTPFRHDDWVYIWDQTEQHVFQIIETETIGVGNIFWSSDGRHILTTSIMPDKPLKIWDVFSANQLGASVPITGVIDQLVWSPGGSRAALKVNKSRDEQGIYILDIETGHGYWLIESPDISLDFLMWSPDETMIAFYSAGNIPYLYILDIRTGTIIHQISLEVVTGLGTGFVNHTFIRDMALSSTADQIAIVTENERVYVLDLFGSRQFHAVPGYGLLAGNAAWSPDGQSVAISSQRGDIQLWDAASGTLSQTFHQELWNIHDVAWSPNGDYLAIAGVGGSGIMSLSNGEFTRIGQIESWDVEWSPDGAYVASSGTGQLWSAADGTVTQILEDTSCCIRNFAWSPDGRSLAVEHYLGKIYFLDLEADREIVEIFVDGVDGLRGMTWSSDGQFLAVVSVDTLHIWDINQQSIVFESTAHEEPFGNVVWSPQHNLLVSSMRSQIHFWSFADDQFVSLPSIQVENDSLNANVKPAFSPDGTMIALGNADGTVSIYAVIE